MFLSVSFAMLAKKSPIYFTRAPRHTEEDAIPVGSWFWECELPMLRYLQQIGIIKDIFVNYVNKEQEQEEQQSFDYPKILLTRKYRYFNHSDHTDKLNGLSEPYEEGKYFPFSCGYPYDASFNRPTIRMHDLKLCITQWKKLCENKKTKQKGTHIPITLLWMGSKSKKSKTTKTKSVVYTGSYSSDYSTMGASQYWPNKS